MLALQQDKTDPWIQLLKKVFQNIGRFRGGHPAVQQVAATSKRPADQALLDDTPDLSVYVESMEWMLWVTRPETGDGFSHGCSLYSQGLDRVPTPGLEKPSESRSAHSIDPRSRSLITMNWG